MQIRNEPRLLIFPWYSNRSGWLFAAVYKELWKGEGRRWPAAEDHPSGAGGSGGLPHRTPGADPGSCGPAVRSGESSHSFMCLILHLLFNTPSAGGHWVPYCTMLTKISKSLWGKTISHSEKTTVVEIEKDYTYLITWTGFISHNIPGKKSNKKTKQ